MTNSEQFLSDPRGQFHTPPIQYIIVIVLAFLTLVALEVL